MISVLLSLQALHSMTLWSRKQSVFIGPTLRGMLLVAVACIAGETLPWKTKLWAAPDVVAHQGWIDFLRRETPPGRAVLCLPFAEGNTVYVYESTTNAMYFGTFHQVPLVNGYSGFFPQAEIDLRSEQLNRGVDSRVPRSHVRDGRGVHSRQYAGQPTRPPAPHEWRPSRSRKSLVRLQWSNDIPFDPV